MGLQEVLLEALEPARRANDGSTIANYPVCGSTDTRDG
jgi:hypothetical protein